MDKDMAVDIRECLIFDDEYDCDHAICWEVRIAEIDAIVGERDKYRDKEFVSL